MIDGALLADDFIQRNSWVPGVVVAIVLFIIGTGVTLFLRRRDRASKHLDYRVISDIPIVTSHDRPETLKVMYGSVEVRNPFITEVRFKNTAKQVIESEDFLKPIAIQRPGVKVLDFNIVDASESGITDDIRRGSRSPDEQPAVKLTPGTLNPGDWFTVQVIYDGAGDDDGVTVAGRITGQTRQSQVYQERQYFTARERLMLAAGALVILVGNVTGMYLFWLRRDPHGSPWSAAQWTWSAWPAWLAIGVAGLSLGITASFVWDRISEMEEES